MSMNSKNKIPIIEIKRKLLHIISGILPLLLLSYNLINTFALFIMLCLGIAVSILSLKFRIPIVSYFLNNFERDKDKKNLPGRGLIFAFAGCILALKLFPFQISLAAIAILTFADPISYLVGCKFGKTKTFLCNTKNIEGSLAGALISSLIALFFVPLYLALPGAIVAMIFELLTIKIQNLELDDNFIIPLATGTAMLLIENLIYII